MIRALFFHMVLKKFIENTNNKIIYSQYNIIYLHKCFFFSVCVLIFFQSSPKVNKIKNNVACAVARLFSCFVVYSLQAVLMTSNISSSIKGSRSFTAHISRLWYFLRLWCKLATSFRLFWFSFFKVKMVNHWEGYVNLVGIGHQLQRNKYPSSLSSS